MRRRALGLAPRQEDLLSRWGYPYVLDAFRFHLTLTGPLPSPEMRDRAFRALEHLTRAACREFHRVVDPCLFEQEDRHLPFRLAARFPFQASPG